jgi:hypothetical protein
MHSIYLNLIVKCGMTFKIFYNKKFELHVKYLFYIFLIFISDYFYKIK